MRAEEIVKIINEDKFNEYDYNFLYEQGRDGNSVSFEVTDGYIILDEDNDSTCITYELDYFLRISHCSGDYYTPPNSGYDEEFTLDIKVYEDGSLVYLNKEDEELIKERISEIITVE